MGVRYNVSHISGETVKDAWANYSKWDYYYQNELKKSQETLKSTVSAAEARLAAKGITKGDTKYQAEIDRVTNIAQADVADVQRGYESLQTGATQKLLSSGDISKYSEGSYQRYLEGYEQQGRMLTSQSTGGMRALMSPGRRITAPEQERIDMAKASLASRGPAQTMSEYYTSVYGGYDPTAEVAKEEKKTSEATARGQAGTRAYTTQMQPKGQPGGGKVGNVFMQTAQEAAREQAPQEEQGKAWWM